MADSVFRIRMIPQEEAPDALLRLAEDRPGDLIRYQKKLYLQKGGCFVECEDSPEARSMMETLNTTPDAFPAPNPREQLFRNWLERKTTALRDGQFAEFDRDPEPNRSVLLFTMKEGFGRPLAEVFKATAPMERNALLIPIRYDTVALIRISHSEEEDDTAEYAMAVIETLEVESGITAVCGIGNCKSSWRMLPESYEEAREALETAERSPHTGKVFQYKEQFLERLLAEVPPEEQKRIRSRYFSPEIRKLLNEEMMETLQVFFRNDLNISTASRQLFIHRNTLLYRLEKIRKLTGLDLRKFTDASTFYILLNLQEENPESGRN